MPQKSASSEYHICGFEASKTTMKKKRIERFINSIALIRCGVGIYPCQASEYHCGAQKPEDGMQIASITSQSTGAGTPNHNWKETL